MNYCDVCESLKGHKFWCTMPRVDDMVDRLRNRLTNESRPHPEGIGRVTFVRTDGRKVVVDNLEVDGIGPTAYGAPGVVHATREDQTTLSLPFIESWSVEYDL